MRIPRIFCFSALALSLLGASASAATVTFSTPTTVSADSDVIAPLAGQAAWGFYSSWNFQNAPVNGVTFYGVDPAQSGGVDSYTYNGVTMSFQGTYNSYGNANGDTSSGAVAALSPAYQTLLYGSTYSNSQSGLVFALSGLTAGTTYEVVFWSQHSVEGAGYGTTDTITSGDVSSEPLINSSTDGVSGNGVGQFTVATFVADDSGTQTFTETGTYNNFPSWTAMEIVAVPEPSTVALLAAGAGLLGLVAVRRFRLVTA